MWKSVVDLNRTPKFVRYKSATVWNQTPTSIRWKLMSVWNRAPTFTSYMSVSVSKRTRTSTRRKWESVSEWTPMSSWWMSGSDLGATGESETGVLCTRCALFWAWGSLMGRLVSSEICCFCVYVGYLWWKSSIVPCDSRATGAMPVCRHRPGVCRRSQWRAASQRELHCAAGYRRNVKLHILKLVYMTKINYYADEHKYRSS